MNIKMIIVRVSLEHNNKDLKHYWISNDFTRNLKVRKCFIVLLHKSSAILLNFQSLNYYPVHTLDQFNFTPPILDEYIGVDQEII